MCLKNAENLGVFPMEAIVKIGDTLPDVAEGINAGMWTIGLAKTGNEIGLTEEEIDALPALAPEPLLAPGWFRCFNAETIAENLATGYARAYLAERDNPNGFDRIVAVFPGGRAYMWRQLSAQIAE